MFLQGYFYWCGVLFHAAVLFFAVVGMVFSIRSIRHEEDKTSEPKDDE